MVDNKHKVQKDQWKKWEAHSNDISQTLFNDMLDYIGPNQSIMTSPHAIPMPPEIWDVTAWNSSWIAAEFVRQQFKDKI